jgi:hypothetical protein
MVVEVGEVESRDCLGEAHPRGKMARDFDAVKAKAPVQTQIDTGPWTSNGKSAKEVIGRAWLKWFHVSGLPGRNEDNLYCISAVKQTQQ